MRAGLIALLTLAVLASGCVGGGSDSASTAVMCSEMQLQILEGNGEEVTVINVGDSAFGNITITWNYASSGVTSKEVPTPGPMERVTYESGDSGSVSNINVQHNSCPSRNALMY